MIAYIARFSSLLSGCLGAMLLPQSYQYPNLSELADRVGGQLRGDIVWKKVPAESAARSVPHWVTSRRSKTVTTHTSKRFSYINPFSSQSTKPIPRQTVKNMILDLFNIITSINELIKWDNEIINNAIKYMSTNYPLLTDMCDHRRSP